MTSVACNNLRIPFSGARCYDGGGMKTMRRAQVIEIICQARDSRERLIEYPSAAKGRQISHHVEVISRPRAPSVPINS